MNISTEKTALAAKFATDAPYLVLFSADPGTGGAATNEIPGTRTAASWAAGAAGVQTGSANISLPANQVVTHAGACASNVQGTADVKDRVAVTWQTLTAASVAGVAATFTQT